MAEAWRLEAASVVHRDYPIDSHNAVGHAMQCAYSYSTRRKRRKDPLEWVSSIGDYGDDAVGSAAGDDEMGDDDRRRSGRHQPTNGC